MILLSVSCFGVVFVFVVVVGCGVVVVSVFAVAYSLCSSSLTLSIWTIAQLSLNLLGSCMCSMLMRKL